MTATSKAAGTGRIAGIGGGLVGYLVFVEFTSGVLQGYYVPLLTDIARYLDVNDADVNWLEAAQLMLSAIAVPVLAKLGDLHGHRRVLLWSAVATALSTVALNGSDGVTPGDSGCGVVSVARSGTTTPAAVCTASGSTTSVPRWRLMLPVTADGPARSAAVSASSEWGAAARWVAPARRR